MAKVKKGEQICKLNDLLFPVEVRNNPVLCNQEYSKLIIGQINGGDFFLNACSPRYELVENKLIFPEIETILKQHGIEFDVQYSHIQNVRFYANYIITDKRFAYRMKGTNDIIQPMLKINHSYNGLTKFKILFGYFRLVCTNGLVIAVQEMKEFNLVIIGKHTETILKSLNTLNIMLENFSANAGIITKAITSKYELLGGRWVENVEDRITEVLKANKITIVENKKFDTLDYIKNKIMDEANNPILGYNGSVNDWLVWQGINQYIYSDRNIVAPELRMEKDGKILEYLLKYPA
jgi:hypothetical protein